MFKMALKSFFLLLGLKISKVPKLEETLSSGFAFKGVNTWDWLKKYKIGTVIDIGANEGQFAKKILSVLPMAEIHCFEPLKEVYGHLKSNFKMHKNVLVYNFGLGAANEELKIFNNEYSPSSSMLEMLDLHKANFDFAREVEEKLISVRRLNDFFPNHFPNPVLLKIDVQGYEIKVLEGGEEVVRQADIIFIETTFKPLYKDQPLFREIYTWLEARGFVYAGNIEQLFSPIDNEILQADAIFVNETKLLK